MKLAKEYNLIDVRYVISLLSLLVMLVLGANVIITMKATEDIIIEQKQAFLRLLSKNIIQNIRDSFLIPASHSFGRISLAIPEQYMLLSSVIERATHEFSVLECNIFSRYGSLLYTSSLQYEGSSFFLLREAIDTLTPHFQVEFPSFWRLLTSSELKATLSSYYPIIIDSARLALFPQEKEQDEDIWGLLEIRIDCTSDVKVLQRQYRNIVITILLLIFCSFLGVLTIIRRTNRVAKYRLQTLEKMKAELIHKERLASIGHVVASLAHEIRNPLGIIYSSIQMSRKYMTEVPERLATILERMDIEINNLRLLVNTFLDYAKPPVQNPTPVLLLPIVEDVCMALEEKRAFHNILITVDISYKISILLSTDSIYRALFNIIDNALDAPQVTHIHIFLESVSEGIVLCVEDDGLGFTENTDIYIEPFYTTKESGLGLGLSIIKQNMEAYGVHLIISNTPSGAKVALEIPLDRIHNNL